MMTIDLINVFCRQSIIGIDPIDVFLTIGAQLCPGGAGVLEKGKVKEWAGVQTGGMGSGRRSLGSRRTGSEEANRQGPGGSRRN
jgi:hypothetical protein